MAKVTVRPDQLQDAGNVLRAIPQINKRIEMLEAQIKRAAMDGAPKDIRSPSFDDMPHGGHRTETMDAFQQLLVLKEQLTEEMCRRRRIYAAIYALDDYSAELLERRYIREELSDQVAAECTDDDTRKFYRHLRDAVSSFAVMYYGSSAVEGVQDG